MSADDSNPYELLGLKLDATEQEIKTAYRQRSLKIHPDKNRNNPNAPRLFHELNQAYELLLDPLRKLALDAKLRLKQARAERYATYDAKRKNLVAELEEREEAIKKSKLDNRERETARQRDEERIKEEGRKMREEKERQSKQKVEELTKVQEDEAMPPEMGSLDTTIRLKYTLTAHPTLRDAVSISGILSPFGSIDADTIQISLKPPKKAPEKPPKFATVLVEFKQIGGAFAAVCASGRADRGLSGIQIDWVEGKEPEIIGWLKKRGALGRGTDRDRAYENPPDGADRERGAEKPLPQTQKMDSLTFNSFPAAPYNPTVSDHPTPSVPGIDYESLTLMRLRQAEKEKLEREIREQETA